MVLGVITTINHTNSKSLTFIVLAVITIINHPNSKYLINSLNST
jgi:hypothetical protein